MMTEQERLVVNCLKSFATSLLNEETISVEDAVDKFMDDAQIAFSEEGKEEIIKHLKSLI